MEAVERGGQEAEELVVARSVLDTADAVPSATSTYATIHAMLPAAVLGEHKKLRKAWPGVIEAFYAGLERIDEWERVFRSGDADAYEEPFRLAGRIDRDAAIEQLMKYSLADRAKATQRLRFIDTYRSYIINYGLGRDVVQAWVERQGPNRWEAMETLLSSQILPTDLD